MATTQSSTTTAFPSTQLPDDHPAQALGVLSSTRLLELVQQARDRRDHPQTQVIFTAFYYRYYGYLFTVVSNAFRCVRDPSAISETVDDTFAAFFRASAKCDVSSAQDEDGADRIIRSYLGKLANWKASDARSFQHSFGADALDLDAIDAILSKQAEFGARESMRTELPPPNEGLVDEVGAWIASLRPVQQDVLRTYFLDDHLGRKSGRLPDGIAQSLATKHNVTTSAIRYIKINLQREMRERFKIS